MMKIGHKTILTIFLILLTFNIQFDVFAQEENNIETGVNLSPSVTIVDQTDLGNSYQITITNNTNSKIKLSAKEIYVKRNEDKRVEPVELDEPLDLLEFSTDSFIVKKNSEYIFDVRVRLTNDLITAYPAVSFFSQSKKDFPLSSELVSVFLYQDFEGDVLLDANTKIDESAIIVHPKIFISGNVKNIGGKFFNPNGVVKIIKDEQLVHQQQITTQIEGLLFPEESVDFSFDWENDLSIFDSVGTYNVITEIQPSPFAKTTITETSFFYLPQELIIYIVIIIAVLLALLSILKIIRKRKPIQAGASG